MRNVESTPQNLDTRKEELKVEIAKAKSWLQEIEKDFDSIPPKGVEMLLQKMEEFNGMADYVSNREYWEKRGQPL